MQLISLIPTITKNLFKMKFVIEYGSNTIIDRFTDFHPAQLPKKIQKILHEESWMEFREDWDLLFNEYEAAVVKLLRLLELIRSGYLDGISEHKLISGLERLVKENPGKIRSTYLTREKLGVLATSL